MITEKERRFLIRGFVLLIASLFVFALAIFNWKLISDGLNEKLMGFEKEPSQGWDYWRWFFIKRSIGGISASFGIIVAIGAAVTWGWIKLMKGKYS